MLSTIRFEVPEEAILAYITLYERAAKVDIDKAVEDPLIDLSAGAYSDEILGRIVYAILDKASAPSNLKMRVVRKLISTINPNGTQFIIQGLIDLRNHFYATDKLKTQLNRLLKEIMEK